jgi:hypothetical protein
VDHPYFFDCEQIQWGMLGMSPDGYVSQNCKPDTLYSWGPREKLDVIKQSIPDGKEWKGDINPQAKIAHGTVFTSVSPASTFGYGKIVIRFKIKKEIPYHRETMGAQDHEIGVRMEECQDFCIKDSSVVESWSYGTPEIYDEVVRDALRIASGKQAWVYFAHKPKGKGLQRVYSQPVDNHVQSEENLKQNLLELIREILNHEGGVFFPKNGCRDRAQHFSTDKHSYINP